MHVFKVQQSITECLVVASKFELKHLARSFVIITVEEWAKNFLSLI